MDPPAVPPTRFDFATPTFPWGRIKRSQSQGYIQLSSPSTVGHYPYWGDRLCFQGTCICVGLTLHLTPTVYLGFPEACRVQNLMFLLPHLTRREPTGSSFQAMKHVFSSSNRSPCYPISRVSSRGNKRKKS